MTISTTYSQDPLGCVLVPMHNGGCTTVEHRDEMVVLWQSMVASGRCYQPLPNTTIYALVVHTPRGHLQCDGSAAGTALITSTADTVLRSTYRMLHNTVWWLCSGSGETTLSIQPP